MKKQSQLKYERLLAKSEELFIKNGYSTISIDEIAAAAGISKVTIYKHFGSKEDLFVHSVIEITNKHYDLLESRLADIIGASNKLNYIFKFSLDSHREYSANFYKDMMTSPRIWEKIHNFRKERSIKFLELILEEGINSGEFRELDIQHTINILLCLGEGLPKIYPFNDIEESNLFMNSYYQFIRHALLKI